MEFITNININSLTKKGSYLYYYFILILLLFIIGNYTYFVPYQLQLLGILLIISYILIFLIQNWSILVPIEGIIYFYWIIWSLLVFLVVAPQDPALFFEGFRKNFEILTMILAIAGIIQYLKDIKLIFIACIIGGLIAISYIVISGDLSRSLDPAQHYRTLGLATNQNLFGYQLFYSGVGLLYFLGRKKLENSALIKKAVLIPLLIIIILAIISSGSRKAYMTFGIFAILWMWMCYRKIVLRRLSFYISIILLITVVYFVTDYILNKTWMGERFHYYYEQGEVTRVDLYREGFETIKMNPIFGVGLNHFRYQSSFESSHSDYIEVLACTGIIGFIIYFSVWIAIWIRLSRIQIHTKGDLVLYNIRFMKALIISILIIAFGRPNYDSQITWILASSAIGYVLSIEKKLPAMEK